MRAMVLNKPRQLLQLRDVPKPRPAKRQLLVRIATCAVCWTDGECAYCRSNRENLCDQARFTGYTIDGGYAEFTVADAQFCFHLPDRYNDVDVAPLLCAGLIGYRSYR